MNMCTLSIPLGYGGLIPQGPEGSIPLDPLWRGLILKCIKKVSIMDRINVLYLGKVYCTNVDPLNFLNV